MRVMEGDRMEGKGKREEREEGKEGEGRERRGEGKVNTVNKNK